MHQVGPVLIALSFAFGIASAVCGWYGMKLWENPPASFSAPEIDPEPSRLLRMLSDAQSKYDLHKLVIGTDGELLIQPPPSGPKVNLIEQFYSIKTGDIDDRIKASFEKMLLNIPVLYLRQVPETRFGSPFVLALTPEGRAYLRGKP